MLLLPGAYSQALASSLTPSREDIATVLSGHAQTKPVGSSTRGITRLKSALHGLVPVCGSFSKRRANIGKNSASVKTQAFRRNPALI